MNLIRPLTFVNVWGVSHALYARQNRLGKPTGGVRRLVIEEGGKSQIREWRNAEIFLKRARRLLSGAMPNAEIARAEFEMIDPGGATPWSFGSDESVEVHVGIVTNPLARVYAGIESWSVEYGQCVLFQPGGRVMRSAVNGGESPRVHAIFTLRLRAIDEGTEFRHTEDLLRTREPAIAEALG